MRSASLDSRWSLDKNDHDVPAPEALGEAQARLPGNRVVEHAVQQAHRACKGDLGARYEMAAAVFEQAKPMGVANRVVLRGQGDRAGFPKLLALRRIEPRPDEILGEVGCRSDPDERVNSVDSRERGEQHDPAAHARADQDLSTLGQRIENGDRVL